MVELDKLVEKMELAYIEEKRKAGAALFNEMVEVLQKHKATVQTTLFVLKMIEFSLLRAKYMEHVEGAVQIPDGSVPIPKDKSGEPAE